MGGPDQPQPALGEAVRQLRARRGITQEQLAQNASLTTGTISLIERGQSNPAWGTIKALAEGLGVPVAEIAQKAADLEAES